MFPNQDTSIASKFNNAGPIQQGTPMRLPDTGVLEADRRPNMVPVVGILPVINSADYNSDHDTEEINFDDPGLQDDDAFAGPDLSDSIFHKAVKHGILGIPGKIIDNRHAYKQSSNFSGGHTSIDFMGLTPNERKNYQNFLRDLSPDELDEYNDFLGINFSKIGKALGGAVKGIGKGIGKVGKFVGKGALVIGKGIGKGAVAVGKGLGKGALAVGKLAAKAAPYLAAAAALYAGEPELSASILGVLNKNAGQSEEDINAALAAQGLPMLAPGSFGGGGIGADFGSDDDGDADYTQAVPPGYLDGQTLQGTGIGPKVDFDASAKVTLPEIKPINPAWYFAGGFVIVAVVLWFNKHHKK